MKTAVVWSDHCDCRSDHRQNVRFPGNFFTQSSIFDRMMIPDHPINRMLISWERWAWAISPFMCPWPPFPWRVGTGSEHIYRTLLLMQFLLVVHIQQWPMFWATSQVDPTFHYQIFSFPYSLPFSPLSDKDCDWNQDPIQSWVDGNERIKDLFQFFHSRMRCIK